MSARIGFLPPPIAATFDGVTIAPLPDHANRLKWFSTRASADGFFYPPRTAIYRTNKARTRRVKVTKTERPAAVFHLPASHNLVIDEPLVTAPPYSDTVLLTQLLAFIFGTRLQLEEWRFEGRVPEISQLAISATNEIRIDFVSHAYSWWKKLPHALRTRAMNVFYAYNRAVSAEWEWDAFSQQYMVFDALYRLHADLTSGSSRGGHRDRFKVLCQAYGTPYEEHLVKALYNARNELFHESMWSSAMIGYQLPGSDSTQYPRHLARLNARLLCSITGYKNSFTSSVWWAMGAFFFDRKLDA